MRKEYTDLFYHFEKSIGPRKLKRLKRYLEHLAETRPLGDRNVNVVFRDVSKIRYVDGNGVKRSVKGAMGYMDGEFAIELAGRQPLKILIVVAAHEWRHAEQRAGLTDLAEGVDPVEELEKDADSVVNEWTEDWFSSNS